MGTGKDNTNKKHISWRKINGKRKKANLGAQEAEKSKLRARERPGSIDKKQRKEKRKQEVSIFRKMMQMFC